MHPEFSFVKLDVERQKEIASFLCSTKSCKMFLLTLRKLNALLLENYVDPFELLPNVLSSVSLL